MNKSKYKLGKCCEICGKPLLDKNKTGHCIDCHLKYDLIGEKNPFYGKKHNIETIEKTKEKLSEISKNLWKNDEYRNKIIDKNTGKKRTEEFKNEQRKRAKEQFKDIKQKESRSIQMKKSWEEGKIVYTKKIPTNTSKEEIEFFNELSKYISIERKQFLRYKNKETNRYKHLFPDGVVKDKNIVIEFNGSFWHADKRLFNDEEYIVHHNKTVKNIRENDIRRSKIYKYLGYDVIYVWSLDYEKDKQMCIKNTLKQIEKCLK